MTSYCTIDYGGGLGNQLFQIFTLLAYSYRSNKNYYFYNKSLLPYNTLRPTYWNTVFSSLTTQSTILNPKTEIGEIGHHKFSVLNSTIEGNVELQGYFQSYLFFYGYKDKIMQELKLDDQIQNVKTKLQFHLLKDQHEMVVSMHFRLGDYKQYSYAHPILSVNYYKNCIQHIKSKTNKKLYVLYFCENDDVDFVQTEYLSKLGLDQYSRINNLEDYEEMYLMSLCDWNIIANSTFSWWGAFFNKHHDRCLYPGRWFHDKTSTDLVLENWIQIDL